MRSDQLSRPIPQALVDKYHRAIFAIDLLGTGATGDRHFLRQQWQSMQLACAMATPDTGAADHEKQVDKVVAHVAELIDRALSYEKDRNRALWEKQRDFIVGSLRRVRRAARMADTGQLHFFNDMEVFNVNMHHPVFQVAYSLWQGLRVELREAMSLAMLRDPEHPAVMELITAIRRILYAMESADVSKLDHYTAKESPLHLSEEQQGAILWEAVREEIAGVVALAEKRVAA